MTEKQIKNSIVILDFLGLEYEVRGYNSFTTVHLITYGHNICGENPTGKLHQDVRYHESYEWIMKAYFKFKELADSIKTLPYLVNLAKVKYALTDENIETFFNILAEAIEDITTFKNDK
jgi:hypothetical protein